MMSTVIFTSSSLRHKALASIIFNNKNLNIINVFHEEGAPLYDLVKKKKNNNLEIAHLEARMLTEKDFFELYIDTQKKIKKISKVVPKLWFSTEDCFEILKKINPSQILVYGTSIIKGKIVDYFEGKILNLHLGLSPYYRGSGTNYFPFVNGEPEYAGSTFMYLDAGIDTGKIIHQIRPNIISTDSFHQLSNRFLVHSFKTFSSIAELNLRNGLCEPISTNNNRNEKRLVYKKSDFSEENIIKLYENFRNGMLEKYLISREEKCNRVPIFEQETLKN